MLTVCDTTCRRQHSVRHLASQCDSSAKLTGQDVSFIRIQPLWRLANGSTLSCEKVPQQGFNRRGSQVLMVMFKNKCVEFWPKVKVDSTLIMGRL